MDNKQPPWNSNIAILGGALAVLLVLAIINGGTVPIGFGVGVLAAIVAFAWSKR